MKRLQAFKFELGPNGAQQRDLRRFAGSCRFVFNKALALQQTQHECGEGFIGYSAMAKHLTEWRNGAETPWLKCAPVHPLQHALKDLQRAYQNFFAQRAGFPRFRRKGSSESFRYPDAKHSFRSISPTVASNCPNWAGFAIATAARFSEHLRTSPSGSALAGAT
jgi:putative transposase